MNRLFLVVVFTTMASALALAAEPPSKKDAPLLVEIEDDNLMLQPFNMTVDQVEDMSIYAPDGSTIGEVDEVLGTKDGKVTGLSTEVGGFLGVGDRDVVLSLDQVQLKDGKLVTTLSKEQIDGLSNWVDD